MPSRRRVIPALIGLPLAIAILVAPGPSPSLVFACSCGGSDDPIRDAAVEPATVVFTGLAQGPVPGGIQVAVTRWFKGAAPGPVVVLDERGFEDPMGGSCGTHAPPTGTEWFFISGLNESGRFDVSLCTTHANLATPEGGKMLASATALFGPGTVADPDPGGSGDGAPAPVDLPIPVILGATLGAALLVLLGAVVVRSRSGADGP